MARSWSSGLELNSTTSDVELSVISTAASIVTSPNRGGTYSLRVNPSGTASIAYYSLFSSDALNRAYIRFALYISSTPVARSTICQVSTTGPIDRGSIRLETDNSISLYDSAGTKIGSSSSPLSTATWHYIEWLYDSTPSSGSRISRARLNGVEFAASTTLTNASSWSRVYFGSPTTTATFDLYYDDLALNNSSGSFQNSYPGDGRVLHLRPVSVGDNSDWTNDVGSVLETTPDDGTTLVSSNTSNQVDDHGLIPTDAFVYQGEGTSGAGFGEFAATRYRGMTFTALSTGIDGIAMQFNSTGSQGLRIYLYAADGSDLPTGSELTHWDIANASLSTSFTKYSLTPYTSLTVGNKYAIYYAPWNVGGTDTYTDDYRDLIWKNANVYNGGKPIVNSAGTWAVSDSGNLDQRFALYYTNWAIDSDDTINAVQVGVRFNGAGASANASFVLRIKSTTGGTVEESSAITPSNTTWKTNANAAPFNYSLTLYDLPGASTTAWTKSTLDTMQIGYRLSSTSTNAAQISTVWALVDYTQTAPAATGSAPSWPVMQLGHFAGPRF